MRTVYTTAFYGQSRYRRSQSTMTASQTNSYRYRTLVPVLRVHTARWSLDCQNNMYQLPATAQNDVLKQEYRPERRRPKRIKRFAPNTVWSLRMRHITHDL